MATKENPGAFDCYANAEPNEPMFVLLGRDKHAPALVEAWAMQRENAGEDPAKVAEARECARSMRRFRVERLAKTETPETLAAAVRDLVYDAANWQGYQHGVLMPAFLDLAAKVEAVFGPPPIVPPTESNSHAEQTH